MINEIKLIQNQQKEEFTKEITKIKDKQRKN